MVDQTSLMNIGDLAKPATALIEKVSDAIGACFEPRQIRRVARAEADAEVIRATAQIEITEMQRRAVQRLFVEEAKKQGNIESITTKALPHLEDDADPRQVEDDWITNFFDRCRLISDEEMQALWAKVLAAEANAPGKYSKRTVNLLGSLDKSDAALFTQLCGFALTLSEHLPLVYDTEADIYNRHGVDFRCMEHLDTIGLVSFSSLTGYKHMGLSKRINVFYYETPVIIEFKSEDKNSFDTGKVILTQTGRELAELCGSTPVPGFLEYVIARWVKMGYVVSSPSEK